MGYNNQHNTTGTSDVIIIRGLWITPMITLLSRPRADKRGGGVGLYVTDKTSFNVRDDLVMNPVTCLYEFIFIETVSA